MKQRWQLIAPISTYLTIDSVLSILWDVHQPPHLVDR